MGDTWNPGDPVNGRTPLKALLLCLGTGQGDLDSFRNVGEKLETRNTFTVGDLEADWSPEELITCLRALEGKSKLKKCARSYASAIITATGIKLTDSRCADVPCQGSNWNQIRRQKD